ncbi:MAG: hypothetical protein ACPG80_02770, partial [Rickettsiales bacterium]
IFAGYIAKQMGLPIGQLIVATNRNDILTRCIAKGEYRMEGVHPSLSPSMDIQISSNFERLLFDLYDRDSAAIALLMKNLREQKGFALDEVRFHKLRKLFSSASVDDEATKATIRIVKDEADYVLDPHTAVGVAAAEMCAQGNHETPLVVLSTAHPAKFPAAVEAACGITPALPLHMDGLMEARERFDVLDAGDEAAVRAFIQSHTAKG